MVTTANAGLEALAQLVQADDRKLRRDVAEYLRDFDFTEAQHHRYAELSAKAQDGSLSALEQDELDGLLTADSILSVLRLKAQASLREQDER